MEKLIRQYIRQVIDEELKRRGGLLKMPEVTREEYEALKSVAQSGFNTAYWSREHLTPKVTVAVVISVMSITISIIMLILKLL